MADPEFPGEGVPTSERIGSLRGVPGAPPGSDTGFSHTHRHKPDSFSYNDMGLKGSHS